MVFKNVLVKSSLNVRFLSFEVTVRLGPNVPFESKSIFSSDCAIGFSLLANDREIF